MNAMISGDIATRALALAASWDRERAARPAAVSGVGHKLTDGVRETDAALTWYVARAATRQEAKAERSLIEANIACYVPRLTRWVSGGQRRAKVQQALFEGYLFLGLAPGQAMYEAEKLEGMHQIVRFTRERAPRPANFGTISLILAAERAGHFDRTVEVLRQTKFEAGEAIKIVDGSFAGYTANFVRLGARERVRVLLHLFGRSSEVELAADDIRKLA